MPVLATALFLITQSPQELKVPVSAIASGLEWQGLAIQEADYTVWGASPVMDDEGRVHLFAARWPESNVDPAWRRTSEIAHYFADNPEGPFEFVRVVAEGSDIPREWDRYAPHNPEIKRYGDTFALFYIANTDYRQPPHPLNQTIGLMTAKSLDGPWEKHGQILAPSADKNHWSYGRQIVNPAIIEIDGNYLLYFKSSIAGVRGTVYAVAIADNLLGPYEMPEEPITREGVMIEDGAVFKWDDKVCLITTDNHGSVTGEVGGGVLWVSEDGQNFDPKWTQLGYYRVPHYRPDIQLGAVKKIYGGAPKLERPKVLVIDGKPAYLYAPSGWALHGGDRTANYVFRINLPTGAGPMPSKS